jgi:small subunit ribosomal protein S18
MNSKQCFFKQNNIPEVDYKDTEILKKFLNPSARILSKKRTGVCSKNQRKLALAIKRARFMALIPYLSR